MRRSETGAPLGRAPLPLPEACEECRTNPYARGLCRRHYERTRNGGALSFEPKTCDEPGCGEPHHGLGKCLRHYDELKRDRKGRQPRKRARGMHMIRLAPALFDEAAAISGTSSAAAGAARVLEAAARFREEVGRTLQPQDIDEAARRVASRRRKGAGNG